MNSSALFRIPAMKLVGIAVFLAALISPVWAQSTGSLVGTVRDESGGVVPDATVSLFRQGMTEPAVQRKTNNEGFFAFDSLAPESYRITVEKTGFAPYEATGVTLSPGTEKALNGIKLSLGQVAVSVKAEEKLAGVQTSDAEVSTTLNAKQMEDLPIRDFNPLELIATQAGVVVSSGGAYTSIDGLRTSFSNVTFDGINVQDNTLRYYGLTSLPNQFRLGDVDQFTLVTSNEASKYGNGATQTAFVSPSGTNELHGSAFFLNSNNLFNANSWFQSMQGLNDAYKYNEGGFNVGGPLVRNKLFGYLDYEIFRAPDTIGQAPVYTLTAQDQAQIAADKAGVQVDNRVAAVLNQIPLPNIGADQFQHAEGTHRSLDNVVAKLNFIPSPRDTIVASYSWNRADTDEDLLFTIPQPYSASVYGNNGAVIDREKAQLLSLSWRTTPSSRLTNEIRFGFDLYSFSLINRQQTLPYNLNLGMASYTLNGTVAAAGGDLTDLQYFNPDTSFSPEGRTPKTYDIQDNASYVVGPHNFRFGFQSQLIRIPVYVNQSTPTVYLGLPEIYYQSGGFYYINGTIDQQVQAILSGQYWGISQNFYPLNRNGVLGNVPQAESLSLDNYALYLQDNWKVNRRLVLTLGLRYDHYTPVSDQSGLSYVPALVNGSLEGTLNATSLTYNLQGDGFYRPGSKNFAPSVGLAFDPIGDGRTALRGSYGIGYVNDDFIGSIGRMLLFGSQSLAQTVDSKSVAVSGTLANLSLLTPPTGGPELTSSSSVPYVIDYHLGTPYVQQWSLGVQHLMAGFVFDLRYVGNHAVRLWRADELFSPTNSLVYLSDPSGSTYNALQFDVSHRLGRHLQFQANYTYSKALTDSNYLSSAVIADPFRDPDDHSLDKGPAGFDIRHAFKTNLVYDLPFGRDSLASMPLRSVLGGWSVSAIAIVTSGAPFSILSGNGIQTANTPSSDTLSAFVYYHMTPNGPSMIAPSAIAPDGTGTGLTVPFTQPADQVFFDPPSGQPGTLGPRSFYGPGYFNLDLALQKRFKITERQSLEFRAVAINALNHPAFGFGNQNIDFSNFGLNAFQLNTPRSFQLRLHYRF